MLSLPAGVAAFSDSRSAIAPAAAIIGLLGALSAYTFSLIGRSCAETKAETYEQSWARSVSPKSSALPAGACVATCFAGCLAYTIIIGDLSRNFLAAVPRSAVIGLVSAGVLLPLALLKNLSALGFTSMLGTGGLLYTAGMMGLRYFDGSYAVGGRFFKLLEKGSQPVFGSKAANPVLFLVLVSAQLLVV
jgi:solute carrier family 38 (sodium-coupled neutral amino acid transporter), member 11